MSKKWLLIPDVSIGGPDRDGNRAQSFHQCSRTRRARGTIGTNGE